MSSSTRAFLRTRFSSCTTDFVNALGWSISLKETIDKTRHTQQSWNTRLLFGNVGCYWISRYWWGFMHEIVYLTCCRKNNKIMRRISAWCTISYLASLCKLPPHNTMNNVWSNRNVKHIACYRCETFVLIVKISHLDLNIVQLAYTHISDIPSASLPWWLQGSLMELHVPKQVLVPIMIRSLRHNEIQYKHSNLNYMRMKHN